MKLTEIIADVKYQQLAREFVQVHNAASAEFSKAFRKIGAKMWHDDRAHPIKASAATSIAEIMRNLGTIEKIRKNYTLDRPLTVLDSYPEAHKHKAELDKAVDQIWKQHQARLDKIFKGL